MRRAPFVSGTIADLSRFLATEARGVSVTQLDSIDPTLVVFRAEATFVGLGIWDLYSTIVTPGARAQWDRSYDDAVLLEDVNELSEVWHWKSKPIWPAKYVPIRSMSIFHHTPVPLSSPYTDDRILNLGYWM